jgi:hypothetical protein
MRLVRFDGWKTGLLVETSEGACVVDVAQSVRALVRCHPLSGFLSAGLINGMLAEGGRGSWLPLIEHWTTARIGMAQLAALASRSAEAEGLVVHPLHTVQLEPHGAALEVEIDKVGVLAAQSVPAGAPALQRDEQQWRMGRAPAARV